MFFYSHLEIVIYYNFNTFKLYQQKNQLIVLTGNINYTNIFYNTFW